VKRLPAIAKASRFAAAFPLGAGLSFLFAFAACGGDATGPAVERLRIEGSVSALGSGTPIESAVIILQVPQGAGVSSRSAATNAEGRYVIAFDPGGFILDCRDFALSASAAGFQPAFEEEVRCTTAVQTVDFELVPAEGSRR
jgi:hypothetical protein